MIQSKVTLVNPPVFIIVNPIAVNHVVSPLTFIDVAIGPRELAVAFESIVLEFADILIAVRKLVSPLSVLHPFLKFSFVFDAFFPSL